METTLATDITLAQLIKAMRVEAMAVAAGTYTYTDLLTDIELLAAHNPAEHLRIYWGVRKNGTTILHNTVQIAKWAAQYELNNELPQCYRITCDDSLFTLTKLA